MNGTNHADVIVVGAGISGLATAYLLAKRGVDVLVLESNDYFGGKVRSQRMDGFLVEAGPNAALETTPLLTELVREVGLEEKKIYADERAKNRFIVRGGRLIPLPTSPLAFLRTPLFSWRAKLRLFKEPFIPRGAQASDESVADFVRRRLGDEFLDYAINPFVAGVYAGDPHVLSVRAAFPRLFELEQRYGGLIRGTIRGAAERKRRAEKSAQYARLFSFTDGMGLLPEALARRLHRKESGVTLTSIAPNGSGTGFELRAKVQDGTRIYTCMSVVAATPARETAALLRMTAPQLDAPLNAIPYPPVAVVVTAYRQRDVKHPLDGFGFLVPERERRKILGTIFSSTIFGDRAPAEYALLTSFIGGMRDPDYALFPEEGLVSLVEGELGALLGCPPQAEFAHVVKWERAIPQYAHGHLERMAAVEQTEKDNPGLFLCANYRGGIAVGDCVRSAHVTADKVERYLAAGRVVPTASK